MATLPCFSNNPKSLVLFFSTSLRTFLFGTSNRFDISLNFVRKITILRDFYTGGLGVINFGVFFLVDSHSSLCGELNVFVRSFIVFFFTCARRQWP